MYIEKLLSISSRALADEITEGDAASFHAAYQGELAEQLLKLLSIRNGFYAFEGALHVLPLKSVGAIEASYELLEWNSNNLWRNWYGDLLDGALFFAEDVFGVQFSILSGRIVSFDPESGELLDIAVNIEDWSKELLANYQEVTGYPVAHAWQAVHGAIPDKKRLLPKIPFILGGEYREENLIAVMADKAMRYRGELWQQLKDLPDGAQVRLMPLPTH